ncbi:hypothetical protein F4808DRAFT_443215 [Astrocystis sublimbata]|nr:hypothetical protein F4808DRAFT_443215 [Astrocystis sublimbata]
MKPANCLVSFVRLLNWVAGEVCRWERTSALCSITSAVSRGTFVYLDQMAVCVPAVYLRMLNCRGCRIFTGWARCRAAAIQMSEYRDGRLWALREMLIGQKMGRSPIPFSSHFIFCSNNTS